MGRANFRSIQHYEAQQYDGVAETDKEINRGGGWHRTATLVAGVCWHGSGLPCSFPCPSRWAQEFCSGGPAECTSGQPSQSTRTVCTPRQFRVGRAELANRRQPLPLSTMATRVSSSGAITEYSVYITILTRSTTKQLSDHHFVPLIADVFRAGFNQQVVAAAAEMC